MEKKIYRFLKYALLFFFALFLWKVFVPRSYDVPLLQQRASTQYWDLTTGSRIGYILITATAGPELKPAIIYLHGGPGGHVSTLDIEVLTPLSRDGYNVYLYDQIGSGQSERLKNISEYTVDRHIRDLKEIVDKIGSKSVVLIGQSWGAILAALFVAKYPGLVQKIVFACPGPMFPIHNSLANVEAPDSLHLRSALFTNAMANKKVLNLRTDASRFFASTFNMKLASDKEADVFQTHLDGELNKSVVCDTSKVPKAEGGGGFYSELMTFDNLRRIKDVRSKLKNSGIQVLVLKGQCDNQKWGFTKEYLDLFPNHQLVVVPNAGHFIPVEQPVLYINTIRQFLKK